MNGMQFRSAPASSLDVREQLKDDWFQEILELLSNGKKHTPSAYKKEDFTKCMSAVEIGWSKDEVVEHCSRLEGLHDPMLQNENEYYYFWSDPEWKYIYYCFIFEGDKLVKIDKGEGDRWDEYLKRMKEIKDKTK